MTARRSPFILFAVMVLLLGLAAPGITQEPVEDEMAGTDEGIAPGQPDHDLVLEPIETPATQGWNPDTGIYEMLFPHLEGIGYYSDTFGAPRSGGRTHAGIDIMAPKMTPIVAVASGTVYWIDDTQGGDCCHMGVRHDDNYVSYYIHLNNDTPGTDDGQGFGFAPGVELGAHLTAGQLIGWVGDSGNAENTGSHTHYELHRPDGSLLNPFEHLNAATVIDEPYVKTAVRGCDFDDDGYDDLVVGEPGNDRPAKPDTGEIVVIPGSVSGPTGDGSTAWNQTTPGVGNWAQPGDEFGAATACGDFDNDGFDDLVVGVPGEDTAVEDAGAFNVLYGSSSGLEAVGDNFWHQNRTGVRDDNEAGDRFGAALAVGDFDKDGYDDLAVGVPGEEVKGYDNAGMVLILSGSADGIVPGGTVKWTQQTAGVPSLSAPGNEFGSALAAGDFDGDGYHDLAIGAPGQDFIGVPDGGMVITLLGSETGLSASGATRFAQGKDGLAGGRHGDDAFGAALAVGDFDASGHEDLAVGVPGDRVGGPVKAGAVNVIYGADGGLTTAGNKKWNSNVGGVPGDAESGQKFGAALSAGEFNGDGRFDLVVGAPGTGGGAGAIVVLNGGDAGVTADGAKLFDQDTSWIWDNAEAGDEFGAWLGVGNFDGLGLSWLAVGVPGEDLGAKTGNGAAHSLRGRLGGMTGRDSVLWARWSPGIPGKLQVDAGFGFIGRAGA